MSPFSGGFKSGLIPLLLRCLEGDVANPVCYHVFVCLKHSSHLLNDSQDSSNKFFGLFDDISVWVV